MSPYPNLRHVRLLQSAAASGSLSQAAAAVGVSQPAASQALAKLERSFGGPLFERHGSGLTVTTRGQLVAGRAERVVALMREGSLRLGRTARNGGPADAGLLERHVSIAQLRALSAFGRAGGFAAAARLLGQSEPSVHRAAREFERLTEVSLFEGRPPAVRLTPAGRLLAATSSLILKELDSAAADAAEHDGRFEGKIVVGTLPLVRSRIVPRAVAAWTARYPAASVEILDGPYDALAHSLAIGEIDMLVGALREGPVAQSLDQETLFEDGLSVVARANHPLASAAAPAISDLSRYGWVLPRLQTPTRAIFDAIWAREGVPPPVAGLVETGSLVALRGVLLETDRLALLSRRQIIHEEKVGLLAIIPVELPQSQRPIGVTTRRSWRPTLLETAFLDAIRLASAED